jgi:hypothetical protein
MPAYDGLKIYITKWRIYLRVSDTCTYVSAKFPGNEWFTYSGDYVFEIRDREDRHYRTYTHVKDVPEEFQTGIWEKLLTD